MPIVNTVYIYMFTHTSLRFPLHLSSRRCYNRLELVQKAFAHVLHSFVQSFDDSSESGNSTFTFSNNNY